MPTQYWSANRIRLVPITVAVAACIVALLRPHPAASQTAFLPGASGTVVQVSTDAQLQSAIRAALPGTTILIAPGTYQLSRTLLVNGADDVTIRGATNNRDDVVLVGRGMTNASYENAPSAVATSARRTTIANLTIRDFFQHAIVFERGAQAPHVYNVRLQDTGGQLIVAEADDGAPGVGAGVVEFARLEYTAPPSTSDAGGIDVSGGAGWAVRSSMFVRIAVPGGLASPAVLFRNGSSDAIVSNNTFVDCQREISMGARERRPSDNAGGIVRNNFIVRRGGGGGDAAIVVASSPDTEVLHNTILIRGTAVNAIESRFPASKGVLVANNLLDAPVASRDRASATAISNFSNASASMFVDAARGDLHLVGSASAAIDQADVLDDARDDWDGDPRPQGARADLGADEWMPAAAPTTTPESSAATSTLAPATTTTTSAALATATTATTITNGTLVAPWASADIGAPYRTGSTTLSNGTWTVRGGGSDIWGKSDQFQFAYQPMTGDGQIVARVASLTNTNNWAKAGVMIRNTLTATSAHAFVAVTAGNGVAFQRRLAAGSSSSNTPGPDVAAPYWVKLVRAGSTFTAYSSVDGASWGAIGAATIGMNDTVFVGLSVTSHRSSALATATFTGVSVSGPALNQPPTVVLTTPTPGASFTEPATIGLAAAASDPDGSIARVEFYSGSTLRGSVTGSPYTFTWTNVAAGSYSLTAVAVDGAGARTTSAAVGITVGSATLTRNVAFTPSPDNSIDVTSYRLDIFAASADLSTATSVASQDLGKPAIVNGDMSVDISPIYVALRPGSYVATVTAIGPGGSNRSVPSATFTR